MIFENTTMRSRGLAWTFLLSIGLLGSSSARAAEMLIFDWNGTTPPGKNQVTECTAIANEYRCGPMWKPVRASFNWNSPVNYAQGTLYIRAQIKSKSASHKSLKLIFNNWQYPVAGIVPGNGEEYLPNNLQGPYAITPGTTRTFSVPVASLVAHPTAGHINWAHKLTRRGVVFKGASGPATVKPAPFNFRYTVVVVSKGGSFSGWSHY
jgi:hypothetical protein